MILAELIKPLGLQVFTDPDELSHLPADMREGGTGYFALSGALDGRSIPGSLGSGGLSLIDGRPAIDDLRRLGWRHPLGFTMR